MSASLPPRTPPPRATTTALPYTLLQLKSLITSGRNCSLRELRVLLSLIVRAGETGDAWPSTETIAGDWGMDERDTRRALAALESPAPGRPALVEVVDAGGGRSKSARRRLAISGQNTRGESPLVFESSATNTRGKSPLLSDGETRGDLTLNPGCFTTETRGDLTHKPGANHPPEETIEETKEETREEKGARRTPARAVGVTEIPARLQTRDFIAAWEAFLQHRREKRSKLTPTAAAAQLAKLDEMGPERAVIAIRHSIANGWQGIFEPANPKGNHNGSTKTNARNIDAGRAKGTGGLPGAQALPPVFGGGAGGHRSGGQSTVRDQIAEAARRKAREAVGLPT